MYYLKIKDQKHRQLFKKVEIKEQLKKFLKIRLLSIISYNNSISAPNKKLLYFQILKKKKKLSLIRVVRRCVLTNRSKSIQFLKLSRLVSKELISFGIVPGYKKAVW